LNVGIIPAQTSPTWWTDNWGYVVGGGMIIVGSIVVTVLVVDDITLIGAADDPFIVAALALITKGIQMILG
jgi:hypothetical protein